MKTPERHAIMVLPEQGQHKHSFLICTVGYICRCAVALMCTYGFSRFIFDALAAELPFGIIFFACAAFCTVFSLMQKSGKLFFIGSAAIAAALIFAADHFGGFKNCFIGAYTAFQNACVVRLSDLGFAISSELIIDLESVTDGLLTDEHGALCLAAVILSALISMMFTWFVVQKMIFSALVFTLTTTASFIFYFGMCDRPFGLLLTLAGLVGCAVMARYDAVFVKRKSVCAALGTTGHSHAALMEIYHTLQVNSAIGGYSGLAAALLAAVIATVPAFLSEPMPDVPAVSSTIVNAENSIIAFANGLSAHDTGIFAARSHVTEPRDTSTSERTNSGKIKYHIEADTATNIYLRSWIGVNYKDDSWSVVGNRRIEEYRDLFGGGFSSELLTAELIDAVDPSLSRIPEGKRTADHPELGFTVSNVHVSAFFTGTNSLALPSYTDPRVGLMELGENVRHRIGYTNYYEGIFVSNSILAPKKFSVISYLPHTPDEYSVSGMAEFVRHFDEQVSLIIPLRRMVADGADEVQIRTAYERLISELSLRHFTSSSMIYSSSLYPLQADSLDDASDYSVYKPPVKENTLAYRYAYEMSADDRSRVHAVIDNLALYDEYVKENYLAGCEGAVKFVELMYGVIAKNAKLSYDTANYTFADIHRAVEAVTDYLSANMKYSLSPIAPSPHRAYTNAAETFLFDTHEGYCVQYATAAVMLLRTLDIPARYAEGYVVTDFEKNTAKNAVGTFMSEVPDNNAHAWIEVYYEGFGWLQYEVTAPFTAVQSANLPSDSHTLVTDRPETTTETSHTEVTEKDEQTDEAQSSPIAEDSTEKESEAFNEPSDSVGPDSGVDSRSTDRSRNAAIIAVSLTAVGIAIVTAVAVFLRQRGLEREKQHRALIKAAFAQNITNEEAVKCASVLNDRIMRMLAYMKLEPFVGEQASEFAVRVDEALPKIADTSFSEVIRTLQAGEFAACVPQSELKLAAQYYEELYRHIMGNSGRIKSIYVKYFLLVS